jgi:hypothetical protein
MVFVFGGCPVRRERAAAAASGEERPVECV